MAIAFLLFSLAFLAFALYSTRKKPHDKMVGDHALVIGCGVGGMIHAKILSKRFKKVTMIERDEMSSSLEFRRGTPQASQFHSLMMKGVQTFTRLFPNLEARYIQNGVQPSEPFKNFIYYVHHGPIGPFYDAFDSKMFPCTRPLLELLLRQELVATTPNLEIIGNTTVTDLVYETSTNSVKGVCVLKGEESEILADLVVDCSGASTKQNSLAFLKQRGLEVSTDEIDAGIGYTSAVYSFADKNPYVTLNGKKEVLSLFLNQPKPDKGIFRGFGMGPVEDNKWHLLWFGYAKNYPPSSSEEDLVNWAKEVPAYHMMKEILAQGTRVSDFKSYRGAKCRRVRLDKVDNFPDGLIISADAFASFTPIYAQGMSFACMCAEALEDTLALSTPYDLRGVAKKFIKNAQTPIELCWTGAAAQDFTVPGVQTNTHAPAGSQFMNAYVDYLFKVAAEERNKAVWGKFVGVVTMTAHPMTLFTPTVLVPVTKMFFRDLLRRTGLLTKSPCTMTS